MKKLAATIILFLIMCTVGYNLTACDRSPENLTQGNYYRVEYLASDGGIIEGNSIQYVKEGENAKSVRAVALGVYHFVKWEDTGSTNPVRTDTNIMTDINVIALFEMNSYNVSYLSESNGFIRGDNNQKVFYGEDTVAVEAIPNNGYLFEGWSDGKLTNPRQERNVKEDFFVSARFTEKVRSFSYVYNGATGNNTTPQIVLSYDELNEAEFVVPEKTNFIFDGWYLDSDLAIKVTDGNGRLFYGCGVFFSSSNHLYAKWIKKDPNQIIYPILMIFIDEINATVETEESLQVDIDYKMPLIQRKVCELIPQKLSKYLNDVFDGRVTFQIDTYFTTRVLCSESISYGRTKHNDKWFKDHRIIAYDIPEMGRLLENYRSVITSYNMNDVQGILHDSGAAMAKYAFLSLDSMFEPPEINLFPWEAWLNADDFALWRGTLDGYVHEFIHTVEMCYRGKLYKFHDTAHAGVSRSEVNAQYLRGEYDANGEKVGIPFSYWEGDLNIEVNYSTNDSRWGNVFSTNAGEINMIILQIPFGGETEEVTAIPRKGYRFVRWSDGVTTPTRQDKNIISYLTVKAIFEKLEI